MSSQTSMVLPWKPNVTVAAIIESEGRFLLVEEETEDGLRFNQPAGHLECREALVDAVVAVVDDPTCAQPLPLDMRGTVFQQRVWQALTRISPGETVSYGELAHRIGSPSAVRAVARACGANPLAVAIPCHRVVGADGSLTGYRWGVERKRQLLRREMQ